jgi:phage terminase small subunit
MSKELTIKERKFAELVVELGNQSEAYRQAYNPKDANADWVMIEASKLMQNPKISLKVNQLKEQTAEQHSINREWIVQKYIGMVETFEEIKALMKKEKLTKTDKEKIYAMSNSGLLKGSDAKGALDSLAKMLGMNEPEKIKQEQKITIEVKRNRDEEN